MSLVPAVTELILAELLYLQYDNAEKPITMYVNSTGTTKVRRPCPFTTHLKLFPASGVLPRVP